MLQLINALIDVLDLLLHLWSHVVIAAKGDARVLQLRHYITCRIHKRTLVRVIVFKLANVTKDFLDFERVHFLERATLYLFQFFQNIYAQFIMDYFLAVFFGKIIVILVQKCHENMLERVQNCHNILVSWVSWVYWIFSGWLGIQHG